MSRFLRFSSLFRKVDNKLLLQTLQNVKSSQRSTYKLLILGSLAFGYSVYQYQKFTPVYALKMKKVSLLSMKCLLFD
jgi:hypothetical protein